MALSIEVANGAVRTEFEHPSGPLEFGRGPQRDIPRCVIAGDQSVSRDQLRIEPLADGRLRLENLSANTPVVVEGQSDPIIHLQGRDIALPAAVAVGPGLEGVVAERPLRAPPRGGTRSAFVPRSPRLAGRCRGPGDG